MGILLITLGFFIFLIYVIYEIKNKSVVEKHKSWKYWWTFWLDSEERTGIIMFGLIIFLVFFLITHAVIKSTVTEKYVETTESTVLSFGGKGADKFTVGRINNNYYVYSETEKGLEKLELPESSTTIKPSSFESNETSAVLITNTNMKKIKKSEKPFMFFSKKDNVREIGGCSCGSKKTYQINVPSNFIFVDIKSK